MSCHAYRSGRLLSALSLLLISQFAVGCAATRTNIPMGEVPLAQAPAIADLQQSKAYMQQAMGSEGYKIEEQSGAEYLRVKRMVERLEKAAGANGFSFPVYIVDAGEDVNAATVNNNTVVVYRELLKRVPSDKAGYDPLSALSFWDKAAEIFGDEGGGAFLSTHPGHEDRKENLEKAMPLAQQYYQVSKAQYAALEAEEKISKGKKAAPRGRKQPKK